MHLSTKRRGKEREREIERARGKMEAAQHCSGVVEGGRKEETALNVESYQ